MLKAHITPDFDGASRSLKFIESSVAWIGGLVNAKHYPKLLNIGCGPGLYAERFAKRKFQVTGVDFSKHSVSYARASAECGHLTSLTYIRTTYILIWESSLIFHTDLL